MYPHGLIGQKIVVVSSKDPSLIGRGGRVVDETKNMVILEKPGGTRIMVPKGICAFSLVGGLVRGEDLAHRQEERIKRFMRCRG
jgi:RNase P/RNase MRP subunit p29